jgi:hypothetical protein
MKRFPYGLFYVREGGSDYRVRVFSCQT